MENLSPTVIVFLTLAIVLAAALAYKPTSFVGQWQKLADKYQTSNSPRRITFPDEYIMVGRLLGGLWPWRNDFAEYAKFDVEVDDDGLWLLYDGPLPERCPPRLFVPGTHVKYVKEKRDQFFFLLHADYPIPMITETKTTSPSSTLPSGMPQD